MYLLDVYKENDEFLIQLTSAFIPTIGWELTFPVNALVNGEIKTRGVYKCRVNAISITTAGTNIISKVIAVSVTVVEIL